MALLNQVVDYRLRCHI